MLEWAGWWAPTHGGSACSGRRVYGLGLHVYVHGMSSECGCVRIHVCVCVCVCVCKHVCTCTSVRSLCAAERRQRRSHATDVKNTPKQRRATPFEISCLQLPPTNCKTIASRFVAYSFVLQEMTPQPRGSKWQVLGLSFGGSSFGGVRDRWCGMGTATGGALALSRCRCMQTKAPSARRVWLAGMCASRVARRRNGHTFG